MTDDEIEAGLLEALETARKDIQKQLGDINPFLAKDPNGRFILLDAYSALGTFRAARLAATRSNAYNITRFGYEAPVQTIPGEWPDEKQEGSEDEEPLDPCCARHVEVWGVASPTRCADCRRPLKVENTKWVYGR